MSGTSAGLKAAWAKRRAKYGKSGVAAPIRDARKAGAYEKKTVAILDKPFRLTGLTPDILAHWKSEYAQDLQRLDRIINQWTRRGKNLTPKQLGQLDRDAKILLRQARQYRRAIATGADYLEKQRRRR